MVHDNPKAIQCDMQATFAAMDQEVLSNSLCHLFSDRYLIQWTAICSHLGVEGFYLAVCGGTEDLSSLKLSFQRRLRSLCEWFWISNLGTWHQN
jgi:hypothetical protein